MQNRYVGDIGDYAKYSLLRALSRDRKLGVSWHLFPDEDSGDGGHVGYLLRPDKWCPPDPETFHVLRRIVRDALDMIHEQGTRSVAAIERSGLLPGTTFWSRMTVSTPCIGGPTLAEWRDKWFRDSVECLKDCDIVFADPDNGLRETEKFRPTHCNSGKSICESEALALAANGRPVVVYHHNTMFPGGHRAEVRYWQRRLGKRLEGRICAVRWRPVSPRTFFILNCTKDLLDCAKEWCARWNLPAKVYFEGYPDAVSIPSPPPGTHP